MNRNQRTIQELAETTEEFFIVLDTAGRIMRASECWKLYCQKHKLPAAHWETGSDFLLMLEKLEKHESLRKIKRVMNGISETEQQFFPIQLENGFQWFSAKAGKVRLTKNSSGVLLHLNCIDIETNWQIDTENVLESMTDAFYLLDSQMEVVYMNAGAEKLLNCNRKDIVGRNAWEMFPEAIGTIAYESYYRVLHERISLEFDTYYEPLGLWKEVKAYPVSNGGIAVYFRDISDRKATERKLEQFAYYDFLTGLPNRRRIEEKVEELIKEDKVFSILFINLDSLKSVNTLYNHRAGDELIKSVASELSMLLTDKVEAGRLEGDEFVIIREHEPAEDLTAFATAVKDRFNLPFSLENFKPISISASIGVATAPKDSAKLEELLAYAETAMHEAKKDRGSSFCIFSPSMSMNIARRALIEKDLAGNLNELGFYFALQPQIHAVTGELSGVEVLSRWDHPVLGMISPVEFINIAEESGTIGHLTSHLLKEVFSYINCRENEHNCRLRTAINVTPSLLANKSFFDEFFELLDEYCVAPDLIELEITENAELTYSDTTFENLLACQARGISIAIDDFGTGFSMLSYLTRFPINKIKLDKFFIQKIGADKKSEGVLRALIQFVQNIKCELVAEGVEYQEEVEFLEKQGCNVHQGYLYDRPMKVEEFEKKYLLSCSQAEQV